MPVGKKKSPAKFIGAVTLGLGVIKGATSIIGGIQEKKRLKSENERSRKEFDSYKKDIEGLSITNPYKDLNTSFENTYEDMTVNQQQAQFQARQGQQSRANMLQNLQGAAGSSGIAGLAQAMANQQQQQTAQISAGIGQQEARNQVYSAQGAAGVQRMEQQAQTRVGYGESMRQTSENERQMDLMNLKAGRNNAERSFRTSMRGANQQMLGGVGDIVGAGLQGFAAGGGFAKGGFKMDTFLGRDGGGVDFAKQLSNQASNLPKLAPFTAEQAFAQNMSPADGTFTNTFSEAVSPSSSMDKIKTQEQRTQELPVDPNDPYYQSDEYFDSLDDLNTDGNTVY